MYRYVVIEPHFQEK